MSGTRTVIFAKAPIAGYTKTRLIPALGAAASAELSRRMLGLVVENALAAGLGPVELCTTPRIDDPAWSAIVWPPGVVFGEQGSGDLGERLSRVTERVLTEEESVLLVGSDCLQLEPSRLRKAAAALQTYDAAMYPAADGGYTLLGLRQFNRRLFHDIAWSAPTVAETTRRRIHEQGWRLWEGETLHDIDVPSDLAHLPAEWLPARRHLERRTHCRSRP